MCWRDLSAAPFTRMGIVCHVPPEPGVFGIVEADICLYVSDTWNLRARLLELANVVADPAGLSVVWEQCPESECASRRLSLEQEIMKESPEQAAKRLPGIHLRPELLRRTA